MANLIEWLGEFNMQKIFKKDISLVLEWQEGQSYKDGGRGFQEERTIGARGMAVLEGMVMKGELHRQAKNSNFIINAILKHFKAQDKHNLIHILNVFLENNCSHSWLKKKKVDWGKTWIEAK